MRGLEKPKIKFHNWKVGEFSTKKFQVHFYTMQNLSILGLNLNKQKKTSN